MQDHFRPGLSRVGLQGVSSRRASGAASKRGVVSMLGEQGMQVCLRPHNVATALGDP